MGAFSQLSPPQRNHSSNPNLWSIPCHVLPWGLRGNESSPPFLSAQPHSAAKLNSWGTNHISCMFSYRKYCVLLADRIIIFKSPWNGTAESVIPAWFHNNYIAILIHTVPGTAVVSLVTWSTWVSVLTCPVQTLDHALIPSSNLFLPELCHWGHYLCSIQVLDNQLLQITASMHSEFWSYI